MVSLDFLQGAGECGDLIAKHDWASTPLGPIESWSPSLRSMVADMLHTKQPMLLFWGPELIQFYNDSFVPSFGRGKHPAAMGQRARECWADAWPVVGAQIDAVMTRGEPAWYENALVPIDRNGRMEEVFWTYSYSPAYDDDGSINGTLVIVTEMTARVLSARRLEGLAQLGIELSFATSHDDALAAVRASVARNAADLPFLRITPAVGQASLHEITVTDAVPGPAWPELVTRAAACTISGYELVFGLSPRLPFDDGYRMFVTQIAQQLGSTLRRIDNANASIAIERDRDNLLMQAPVPAALTTGPEHVYQLANERYCRLAGRDPTGKSFGEAFPELNGTPMRALLDRAYQTGERVVMSERLVQLDRGAGLEDTYFNFNIEPLRADDHVYGTMAIAVDITDQVRARQALQDANRAKDEFLAMLGHELRNPLAPIVTAIELMNEKTDTPQQERTVIERQVRHVIRLVDDLLDVSRITRGLITLQRTPVDLAAVVGAAVEASSWLVAQREHRIAVDTAPGVLVDGDESRLVQIVSNLLTNAARYTPNGGEIRVVLKKEGTEAVLRVSDTGIGIDAELLPKVFGLFVQGSRSADRAEGGLGLGLAIVKNLVVLHGGSVDAESAGPGRGSQFTVRLPLAPVREAAVAPARVTKRAAVSRRLLVVDDNEDAANLLGEIARMRGHEVTIVHDPNAALAVVAAFQPEVAVLDIGLPGMDGYELAGRLRVCVPDCRLIALTGYGQRKDRERALAAGFSAHLVKPVKVNDLLEMIGQ